MKIGDKVKVLTTNGIGKIINKGKDGSCTWYRTDIDGIREEHELFNITARLEELRTEIREERISYGELAELQSLSEHIDEGDPELLQWAGVPE